MKYYTIRELSKELGISRKTLKDYTRSGMMKSSMICGKYYVSQESVDEFFANNLFKPKKVEDD